MGRPISLQQTLEQVLNVGNAAGAKDIVLSDSLIPPIKFGGTTASFPGLRRSGTDVQAVLADNSALTNFACVNLTATGTVRVGSTSAVLSSTASGTLAVVNGTSSAAFQVYNTTDDPSAPFNSERFEISWASNVCRLRTTKTGTGTARALSLQSGSNNVLLLDDAGTSFGLLQLGGTTSSFPALKRTAAGVTFRLADDSGNAGILADTVTAANGVNFGLSSDTNVSRLSSGVTCFGTGAPGNTGGSWFSTNGTLTGYLEWFSATRLVGTTNANLVLSNNAQTSFGLLQFGGTTSSFPAIKRNGAGLDVRLADDSAYATLAAGNMQALASGGSFFTGTNGSVVFENGGGARITGGATSNNLYLIDNAGTSFGLLAFGGSTTSYPALRRNGSALDVVDAIASAYTNFNASIITANSWFVASTGTIVADSPLYNGSQTWNNAAVAFSAVRFTITDTASAALSYLLDLRVGATTPFSVDKAGTIRIGGATSSFPALRRTGARLDAILADASAFADTIAANVNATGSVAIGSGLDCVLTRNAAGVLMVSDGAGSFTRLQFGGTTASFPALKRNSAGLDVRFADDSAFATLTALQFNVGATDVVLSRQGAGTLALSNGVSGANFYVYQTTDSTTSPTNFERLEFLSATQFYIRTIQSGTGTARPLIVGTTGAASFAIMSNNTNRWQVDANGHFGGIVDNTYDIGPNSSSRPRNLYLGGYANVPGSGAVNGETAKWDSLSEEITLSTSGTTTDSVANLLPAGAVILAVTARVTVTITTATAWQIGDATTANRFVASQSVLTAGTTAVGLNHNTVAGNQNQANAAKVRITTTGTPGAGKIRVTVHFMAFTAPTS